MAKALHNDHFQHKFHQTKLIKFLILLESATALIPESKNSCSMTQRISVGSTFFTLVLNEYIRELFDCLLLVTSRTMMRWLSPIGSSSLSKARTMPTIPQPRSVFCAYVPSFIHGMTDLGTNAFRQL